MLPACSLGTCLPIVSRPRNNRATSRRTCEFIARGSPFSGGDPPLLMTNRFHLALSPLLAAGSAIAHTSCAAEEGKLPTFHYLPHMLHEALLIHWYVTGCRFACLTGNKAIVALITWPGRTEPPRGSRTPRRSATDSK